MRVLALGAHTDDIEFGCGGTLSRLSVEGHKIFYVSMGYADDTQPEILHKESSAAVAILGIDKDCCRYYNYQRRIFLKFRQEILDDLILLNRELKPDVVLLPYFGDIHQDHKVVAEEGLRAFKTTSCLSYELPWNHLNFGSQVFVPLKKEWLKSKIRAIACYKSQKHKYYASKRTTTVLAAARGAQIGVRYAEVFEMIRWILSYD